MTGMINERWIAGMAWDQVLHARLIGAVLMVPVARPYGVWRDWVMQRAGSSRMSKLMWDSVALVSFQVPIYAGIIAFSGASGSGLVRGTLGAAVMMLLLGRPYGAFLNLVRRFFGLPPGGERPPAKYGGHDELRFSLSGQDYFANSSLRTISAPALNALSLPVATRRDSGVMPQLVDG
jgi:hypothetical protein